MVDFTVSVVIPVYNRSHVIKSSIDSVLNQIGQFKVEINIVDDFSTDRNELISLINTIRDSIESDRFTLNLFLHEENRHGGAARNTGINHSRGDYIAFLDSDDIWEKDKLIKCCDLLRKGDMDFVYHKLSYNNSDVQLPSRAVLSKESYMDYLICSNGSMQTSTLVFKREVFDIVDFSEDLKKYQDFDLILKCEINNLKVGFIPEVLTIMDNSPSAIRISNSFDPASSIYWFDKVKSSLSKRAQNTFIVSRIFKYYVLSGKKVAAISYAWKHLNGSLSKNDITKLMLFLLFPLFVIDLAKKAKHKFLR